MSVVIPHTCRNINFTNKVLTFVSIINIHLMGITTCMVCVKHIPKIMHYSVLAACA